jgi:hypothetical protein
MAKPKQAEQKLPGAPLAQFRAVVDAIAELRDAGKALIFLHGDGAVRIIGLSPSAAEFLQQLSERLEGEVPNASEIQEVVREIEGTISVILITGGNETRAAERLLFSILHEFASSSKFDDGNPVHKHVFSKVQATMKLATDALKQRLLRLLSVTIPVLDDLDAELVRERHDKMSGKRVDGPFLRLRLRYGEMEVPGLSHPLFRASSKSFELECDLSDLDLLQHRIDEARRMLLNASTLKEVGDDKKE